MLRNLPFVTVSSLSAILNEVLSLNAQESRPDYRYATTPALLNEVLSLNAQEWGTTNKRNKTCMYPQ